ncbi:MAG: DUF4442 domain-containing protein [Rubrobacteraceae bacterium]
MKETLRTKLLRWSLNLFPAYFATGARITAMSGNLREVDVKLPRNWRTRNSGGTISGGSMYAAIEPIHARMLSENLGSDYVVSETAATIRFRQPGRKTLYARFVLGPEEIEYIETMLEASSCIELDYLVDLTDENGEVHASVEKTLHVQRKNRHEVGAGALQELGQTV